MFTISSHQRNIIETVLRLHLAPVKIAITKILITTDADRDVGKGPLYA